MHSLLHDIPRFLILSLEELFSIFSQMLTIREFGRWVFVDMLISVEEEELSSVVTSEQEFVFQEYAVK